MYGLMHILMDVRRDAQMDGCINAVIDGCLDIWILERWTD
jgi:hypothetical protein